MRLDIQVADVLRMEPVHVPDPGHSTFNINQLSLEHFLPGVVNPVRQRLFQVSLLHVRKRGRKLGKGQLSSELK